MIAPRALLAALLIGLGAPTGLSAQESAEATPTKPAPLEDFVRHVARLWSSGEVAALVEMMPEDKGFTLDTGAGETGNARHAAAALRALFDRSETLEADPVRVTVSSAEPPSGFGEISWTYRARGAPGQQSRSVYVGARWGDSTWRITELRVMP